MPSPLLPRGFIARQQLPIPGWCPGRKSVERRGGVTLQYSRPRLVCKMHMGRGAELGLHALFRRNGGWCDIPPTTRTWPRQPRNQVPLQRRDVTVVATGRLRCTMQRGRISYTQAMTQRKDTEGRVHSRLSSVCPGLLNLQWFLLQESFV